MLQFATNLKSQRLGTSELGTMDESHRLRNKCRCRNLDDPNKFFRLVVSAFRHINGKGATVKEVRCYITKYHRVPMSGQKLNASVEAAVCKAELLGFLRRNPKTGKYYIAATSGPCPKDTKPKEKKCEALTMDDSDDEEMGMEDDEDECEERGELPQNMRNYRDDKYGQRKDPTGRNKR